MSNIRALIIEDNKIWQERIRRALKDHGCDVDIASDYDEAERKLMNNTYDMVTLDMVLNPDEENESISVSSGWGLLVNQLTVNFPGTAIFVISASFGSEIERISELYEEHGIAGYMSKGKLYNPTKFKKWISKVQTFKAAGGRPDVSRQELLDIYKNQPDITSEELLDLYRQQLAIHRKNKLLAERTQARYGIDTPLHIEHSIEMSERAIKRIEAEIEKLST